MLAHLYFTLNNEDFADDIRDFVNNN
jgi:hypothetical protein